MNIPEIQLSNYKDIQRYKPLTDRNMIEMIMEKQDIMKMNKRILQNISKKYWMK